jgi:2-keto-4-pentenoate hydratase/2-oxohepta-3-ene-1,7-dioic acid hydratase in catechol pathway
VSRIEDSLLVTVGNIVALLNLVQIAKMTSSMKIVRFTSDGDIHYGLLKGQTVQLIHGKPFRGINTTEQYFPLRNIKLLAPCTPTKIIGLGLNYHDHAKELGMAIPDSPLTFLKPSSSVIGHEENIIYPSASHQVDYEGELAVVIKKHVWRASTDDALNYVLGYTGFNDVTARDFQSSDSQWTRAKGYDTFAAVGPWIETDLNPDDLLVETYLNGKLKQRGSTKGLIYSVAEVINFISHVMTLLPGDIIAMGTPSGVGPMYPGDTVEVKIKPIGTLRNFVVENS